MAAWRTRPPAPQETASVLVEVSVEPSVPPPPEPAPAPAPRPQERPKRHALPTGSSPRSTPSPSASNAPPTDPAPPGPGTAVDLTGETLVFASTGGGSRLGRGAGRNLNPAPAPGVGTGDRSGGVALEDRSWACPWPREADTARIDEQTVVIKVVVAPDGRVESAAAVSDPGHGFGPAAIACALRTRFIPARDREGRPIRAESPSVAVRFTR